MDKDLQKEIQDKLKEILNRKNIDYANWKKEVVNKRKLQIMGDEDRKWTEQTILEESIKEIIKDKKPKTYNQTTKGSETK